MKEEYFFPGPGFWAIRKRDNLGTEVTETAQVANLRYDLCDLYG